MPQIQAINQAVQYGRGVAARVLGQQYTVYRLGTTSGSVTSGPPVISPFRASLTHWTSKIDIENATFELMTFAATCDNRQLEVGDILVESGYGSDGAMYAVADLRPFKQTMLVRVEQAAAITRPFPAVGRSDQMPSQGAVSQTIAAMGYSQPGKFNEQILVLTNGLYSWSSSGVPAVVPVGLQALNRLRDYPPSKLPTDPRVQQWAAYIPLLPGIQLEETHIINAANGDRYAIYLFYLGQVGLEGYITLTMKTTV